MPGRRQHGEGSLYQRKSDGLWVAVADLGYRNGRRERRYFAASTPDAAIAKRRKFERSREDGFTMPKGRQPYVSEWLLHWLHNVAKGKVEATTWEGSYRQKVTELTAPYFEKVPLSDLDEEMVEAWHRKLERRVSDRTGKPLSPSTIGQCHRIFSSAVKVAVIRGKMPRNPVANVTPPRVREAEIEPPSAGEVALILQRCASWPNGARWVLAIATGVRQGEALALERRDVRLAAPASVRIRVSAAMVRGQGRVVKPPKSDAGKRTVPLPAVAVTALRAHFDAHPGLPSSLVFTTARGRPVYPAADWGDWCALLDDLGLPHYRVHDCRHAYATMLLEQGVLPRVVQELMGWSSAAMMKRYQHVRPVMHQAAADAMDRALGD